MEATLAGVSTIKVSNFRELTSKIQDVSTHHLDPFGDFKGT
jgi:hypothetical protein